MSYHCYAIAVKHAYTAWEPSTRGEPDWEGIAEDIELWAEMQDDAAHPATWTPPAWYTNKTDAELGYGWVIKRVDNGWEQQEVKEIYATPLRKDGRLVYAVNSSEYSMVGEREMSFFSDDEGHLQDFLNDFFPGETYESDVAVKQML